MNVGVYVAAGPNPIFLRMFLLQLARQTRLPEFLAIYENGYKDSAFSWVSKDIIPKLEARGMKVIHKHAAPVATSAERYMEALRLLLYETETDIFLKMDLDDFYTDEYVENTVGMLGNGDIAINQNSGLVLVRPYAGDFKHKASAVMCHSPMGAAPTHVSFTRNFAKPYLGYLTHKKDSDIADDDLMAECAKDFGFSIYRIDGPVDYMYVSHGTNHSSSSWQTTGGKIYFDK